MIGPLPYRSFDQDSPFRSQFGPLVSGFGGRYASDANGGFFFLEDFEDGILNTPGLLSNDGDPRDLGAILSLRENPHTDSVGEDRVGDDAHSFSKEGCPGTPLEFSFDRSALGGRLPTHAGIVLTDGPKVPDRKVVFQAFDGAGHPVGRIERFAHEIFQDRRDPAPDRARFFGVIHPEGVSKISLAVVDAEGKPLKEGDANYGFEVDHIQYNAFARPTVAAPVLRTVNLRDPRKWEPSTEGLEVAADVCNVRLDSGIHFSVGQLGAQMQWSHHLPSPVATKATPWVTIRYRARGLSRLSLPLLSLEGQGGDGKPATRNLLTMSNVEDDGGWHMLAAQMPRMQVQRLKVQLYAAMAGAWAEVDRMDFSNSPLSFSLGDVLEIHEGWSEPTSFHPVPLRSNASAGGWLAALGFSEAWFKNSHVTLAGVPFEVATGELNVMATQKDEPFQMTVEINDKAEAIYLLLGARFEGNESPTLGTGPRRRVEQPDQFVILLNYADGGAEKVFPARFPQGTHSVSSTPGIYLIRPSRNARIRNLTLIETVRKGQFFLGGVTLGPALPTETDSREGQPSRGKDAATIRRSTSLSREATATKQLAIAMDGDSGRIRSLINRITETEWLGAPNRLYDLRSEKPVSATLNFRPLANGEIEITLKVTNRGMEAVRVTPTFPVLRGLSPGGETENLGYCFPRRSAVIDTQPVVLKGRYSGIFPLQFMDVFHPLAGGIYLMTHDLEDHNKIFWLEKKRTVDMGVEHFPKTLEPGETWELPPAVIGAHGGDWHAALHAYRAWVETWYRPWVPRQSWFREVFNFRTQFLHFKQPVPSGAFDEKTHALDLVKVVRTDIEAFGGLDYLHLFDWAWTPDHGRTGDYTPWKYLGGLEAFQQQVREIQAMKVPVGLYLEGYLIHPTSDIGKAHGKEWQMIREDGRPESHYAESYHACPYVKDWQDYLVKTYERVAEQTGANGFYIDQFGFATQYACYNRNHGHPVPAYNLEGERELTGRIRKIVPPNTVVYTEAAPTDFNTQFQDGAFSAAVIHAIKHGSTGYLNMGRFALPDFKTFELLSENGIYDDLQALKIVFYNGEGIYLTGVAREWYSPEALTLLAKTHRILREHRQAFTSMDPEPLVPTEKPALDANRFPARNEVVWTLFNTAYRTMRGELLAVEHREGAEYYDAWNERAIPARVQEGWAFLTLEVGPRDAGCVVQRLPPDKR